EWILAGNALAPAFKPLSMHGQQQNAPLRGAPKTCFKEMHQRHTNFTKSNCFDFHCCSFFQLNQFCTSNSKSRKFREKQPASSSPTMYTIRYNPLSEISDTTNSTPTVGFKFPSRRSVDSENLTLS